MELDRLDAFAGRWESTGELRMANADEVIRTTGTNEARWEGDGWYLVSRGTFGMGDMDKMQAMETWTYDSHDKVYRSTWVDNMGSTGMGTSRYDEKTGTWRMRAHGHGPFGGTCYTGTVTFPEPNTMEWTWKEYALWGLIKTMEMNGTSHRQ